MEHEYMKTYMIIRSTHAKSNRMTNMKQRYNKYIIYSDCRIILSKFT